MNSTEIFKNVARIVGQMALHMQAGRATRTMLRDWASSLREAAGALDRLAGERS